LRSDAQGWVVGWSSARGDQGDSHMNLTRRVLERGSASGLQGAVTRRGMFGPTLQTTDQAGRLPYVILGGRQIALSAGELAIAGSFVMNSEDALVGTSKALMRLSPDGRTLWRVVPGAEVNAVVSTRQGSLVITAHSDGSLRWWRAQDGSLVLTLLPTQAGTWVAWTPQGYYDASAGADKLVGWQVQRGGDGATEFHTLDRFRDRYNRPDIVDLALQTLDPVAAVAQAPTGERKPQQVAVVVTPSAPSASASWPTASLPGSTTPASTPFNVKITGVERPGQLVVAKLGPTTNNVFLSPPSLSLASPQVQAQASDTYNLRYTLLSDSQLGKPRVEVRWNSRPIEATLELPAAFDGRAQGRVHVKLPPGAGTLELVAITPVANSAPLLLPIQSRTVVTGVAAAASVRAPRLFVLAVGVSNYQNADYRLNLPAKDATDFAAVMQEQSGKAYRSVEVRRLVDAQATRQQVLDGLQWLASAAQPGDVTMLFMAGHGVNVHNDQYYFLPVDGQQDRLPQTAVPESAIRNTLSQVRGQVLFFVDTCHAGNAIGNFRNAPRELSRLVSVLTSSENGVVVFASSSGRQDSEESNAWGNGAFTKALVSGLRGAADYGHTGRVTYKGLDLYVSQTVSQLTQGRQTPVTIAPVGVADFELTQP
jgi:hypothetical protein